VFEVELLHLAEIELSDSFDWYEENAPSTGKKFYHEVNRYLQIIEQNPFQFAVRYADVFRAEPLNKFPFLIIYWDRRN
jgi:hypothetical protein